MKRTASAAWKGALADGTGTISTESGTLSLTPYSFKTRFEDEKSGTNPEELLGAAHAGCFTMALSHMLAEAGYPVTKAETKATVEIQKVDDGFEIPNITLSLVAEVPGIADEEFQRIAGEAKAGCPLSKVLNANIEMNAKLAG